MITPVLPDQPTAQAPQSGPEEPPAQMPAWLASFTDVLTGLSNRLQFHQPPHPPHHSPPPKETEVEQLMSTDDGIDMQSPPPPPPDDNNNNLNINKSKSVKKSEKSRTNIKLTREADMSDNNSDDEGSDISEHTQYSKRARLTEVDQLPLTLLDGKGFMYSTLGPTLPPLPPVVMEVRQPGDLHEPTSSSPDLSQFPTAVVVAKAMTRHNRYLQGLDKASKPSEVDCSSKRLQDVQVDHDISTKGFSMSKQKCKGLRMDSHYKDRPVPVDQEMLALVCTAPPPLATLLQWEEVEKSGHALLGIMSMNEYFKAAIRHHIEAVRLSEEDPDIPPADKEPFNFPMIRRLTDSLVEATRHITDIAVKQVSQAVLVRRNAYLAKAPLTDRVKKPLRAQPLESPKLFAGKMVEALDLDREERKAQPAKQSQAKSYSGGRQQTPKSGGNNNSNSSKQDQGKGYGTNSNNNNNNSKRGGYRNHSSSRGKSSNRGSSSKSSRGGRGKP